MKNTLIVVASLVASFALRGQDRLSAFTVEDTQIITDTRGVDLSSYREGLMSAFESAASKRLLKKTAETDPRVVFEGKISRNGRLLKLTIVSQSGSGTRPLIEASSAALGSVAFPPLPKNFVGDNLSVLFIVTNRR